MRACIIGAGAAGLCAARHLSALTGWTPVIFEGSSNIAGVWVYDDEKEGCQNGYRSSMYRDLRTNLPKEVMAFPDFPFPSSLPSFIGHSYVRKYLEAYAEHFDLRKYVKFNHEIISVDRSSVPCKSPWTVRAKNLITNEDLADEFDACFICNGHYSKPSIPDLPGATEFRGVQMHSTHYRIPEKFSKMRVACLGGGPSGIDIALDLCSQAEKVYLCHKLPRLVCPLPENLVQSPNISRLTATGFVAVDTQDDDGGGIEKEIPIDALVYCTGYEFDFPFLGPSCRLTTDGRQVTPLYQHLVNIREPSMFVVGICLTIIPFPIFDTQMEYVARVLAGKTDLPNVDDMLEWEREDYRRRTVELGLPHKKAHLLGQMQFAYMDGLAELGGFELRVPRVTEKIYNHSRNYRQSDLLGYHSIEYEIVGDCDFVAIGKEGKLKQ